MSHFLEKKVQHELDKLDRDLFLDKEWRNDTLWYTVKYNIGSGAPPLTVLDWHLDNKPLPLSTAIIDRVKMFEGDITEAIREITVNNAIRKQKASQEAQDIMETIEDEFNKSAKRLHMSGPWSPGKDASAYKRGKP